MEPVSMRLDFLEKLMGQHGGKKSDWHNMNHTLHTFGYKVSVGDAGERLAEMVSSIYTWNLANGESSPIVVAPLAGWDKDEAEAEERLIPVPIKRGLCGGREIDEQVEKIYTDSFSLSPMATTGDQEGCTADVIVNFPPEYQGKIIGVFSIGDKTYLRMPAGLRMRDAEEYLLKRKLAFVATQPTVQYVSGVGALTGTGSYGPSSKYRPLSTYVVSMRVIDPQGNIRTLSKEVDPELFARVRDCHLGAGFIVLDMVLEGIVPAYRLKRTDQLLRFSEVAGVMNKRNPFEEDHFVGHYIPLPDRRAHSFRYTTFEPTDARVTERIIPHNLSTIINYIETNAADGIIQYITNTPDLQRLFKLVLEAAALKTFGVKKKVVQVHESAEAYHLLDTYTDNPFVDNNFLITIESPEHGREVLQKLLNWIHATLQAEYEQDHLVPVLTVYMRHTKGIYYPEGTGGIAPTGVSQPNQSILSIEPLTYTGLAKTDDYKRFLVGLKAYMDELKLAYREHPGKTCTMPRLANSFTDEAAKGRLEAFRKAISDLHQGNIDRSPFMTKGKRDYIFGGETPDQITEVFETAVRAEQAKEEEALRYLARLADEHKHTFVQKEVAKKLEILKGRRIA